MKRIIALCLLFVIAFTSAACNKSPDIATTQMEPQITQMKAICELAVMECYYHNIAKFSEEDASGFLWWKKDKRFWIEYSGVVKLGIDISLVTIEVNDTQVTISIPAAKVLDCKVDSASLSEESFFVDSNSADITAEDEVKAFDAAQSAMEETAANDKTLLANAQQRAQMLLENYIENIGNTVGKSYSIRWIYLDAEGSPLNAPSGETGESPTASGERDQ